MDSIEEILEQFGHLFSLNHDRLKAATLAPHKTLRRAAGSDSNAVEGRTRDADSHSSQAAEQAALVVGRQTASRREWTGGPEMRLGDWARLACWYRDVLYPPPFHAHTFGVVRTVGPVGRRWRLIDSRAVLFLRYRLPLIVLFSHTSTDVKHELGVDIDIVSATVRLNSQYNCSNVSAIDFPGSISAHLPSKESEFGIDLKCASSVFRVDAEEGWRRAAPEKSEDMSHVSGKRLPTALYLAVSGDDT
ncbi:hypothetical protein DFH11DRAFT_1744624 [Phellopilus nigrolimitatus]|nr:hypothetical protein DFH11DRAFT_1744624 [Phellopilus nigrolimitatus]